MRKTISTNLAPQAIGPYEQAIQVDNFIFVSGQIPLNADGVLVQGDIVDQTKQIMQNIQAILNEAEASLDDVVKSTIFLTDMQLFGVVNQVYETFFPNQKPARSTVAVKELPKNASLEIEVIAFKK